MIHESDGQNYIHSGDNLGQNNMGISANVNTHSVAGGHCYWLDEAFSVCLRVPRDDSSSWSLWFCMKLICAQRGRTLVWIPFRIYTELECCFQDNTALVQKNEQNDNANSIFANGL